MAEGKGSILNSLFVQDLILRWEDSWFCGFRIKGDAVHFWICPWTPSKAWDWHYEATTGESSKDEKLKKEWMRIDSFLLQVGMPSKAQAAEKLPAADLLGRQGNSLSATGDTCACCGERKQNIQLREKKSKALENGLLSIKVFSKVVKPPQLL